MTTLVDSTFHVLPRNAHEGTLRKEDRGSRAALEAQKIKKMIPLAGWTKVVVTAVWLQFCVAAFAQGVPREHYLGTAAQISPTGQTGAGTEKSGIAAAKSGEADGTGNPRLGGGGRPLYRLHNSDVMEVTFTLSPEFDQILTIQPDGYVTLKDAGPVLAQGLTLEEFRVAVVRAYTGYLHDPQPGVALKEFEHPYFVAGGEVGRPGKYELHTETSIMDAVEIAGGLTHQARHSQVLLFRHVNDDLVEARIFNLKKMLKQKTLAESWQLRPGDLVYVPQNSISKIERFLSKPSVGMYVSSTQF